MTLFIVYLVVSLIFVYINATACYIRGMKYPWRQDIPLCLIWPVTAPIGILAIIASESRP